jgi:hypothetical protein
MRRLREERGLRDCRKEASVDSTVPRSLVIVWVLFVVRFEAVSVNKDVMYWFNIDVARLICFFCGGGFLARGDTCLSEYWKLTAEETQPESRFSRGIKENKMRL